ncbi:MAG: DUF4143 domain-containing protein [Paludibacteraceae bacterium]
MENQVFVNLLRKGYDPEKTMFYYRTRNDKEIDFVLRENNRVKQLVQVSYEMTSEKTIRREEKYIKIRHKALTECVHWGERRYKSYFLGLLHILICGKRRQPPDRALGAKKHNHYICCRGSDLLIMDCRFRRRAHKRNRKTVDRR